MSLDALVQRFAEPGVAFVHRPDRPSACAYRLLGSASTYSRPVLGASALYDGRTPSRKSGGGRTCRKLRRALPGPVVGDACDNRPVRPRHLLVLLVPLAAFVAGCGGGDKTYSAEKSRACLLAKGHAVSGPPASDLVASAAEGGSFTVRFGRNFATVSFGTDRDGAERIVRAYQRFRGKNIGLLDVLSARGNAVTLWAMHPEDSDVKVIEGCLV
jgi:hypothetical protein